LDEVNISQQYYIATRSSPADERTRVLKYGEMFAVFDRYGDIEPLGMGEQGIFFRGTRFLSEFVVYLWNSRPLLLSSAIKTDNVVFTADLANVDVYYRDAINIPRDKLHLLRSCFLWQGVCYEEFVFVNYGLTPITVPFRIAFGADFADIFEVRGMRRERRGTRLPDEIDAGRVVLGYEGLDNVTRRTVLQFSPEPATLSASEANFEMELEPQQQRKFYLSIACNPEAQRHSISYSSAMSSANSEHKVRSAHLCRIRSTNDRFSRWIKRSVADLQMMTVGNPETEYPYAGVPWFSTVFGRDGIITALQTLWVNPAIARGVLQYLASTQAHEVDPENEAEPGKILHEMRHGELAATGEVPFGKYYGTVDATPLFIMLAGAYFECSGDREFLKEIWANIDLALHWIDHYGDVDGDGFVEYAQHSRKGLVQQGWKDSNDSIFHADGKLAAPPIALCEVQGYVYAAKLAASRIADVLGDSERAATLKEEAERFQQRFEDAFWCGDISSYALALDGSKRACRVRASNAGHCLYTGIASRERANLVAHTLLSSDFFTGWGIRTVASGEARYNPISYHNGSVWPHDNALIASGLGRYGFKDLAGQILLGFLDVSSNVEWVRLPELFCGFDRRRGVGPTLYPVACAPQAWAAGSVFMLLEACLGISIDGPRQRISFLNPTLPQGIPQLSVQGLRVGTASLNLLLQRRGHTVTIDVEDKQGDAEVVVI
jgi:glycogen debranching enzyme